MDKLRKPQAEIPFRQARLRGQPRRGPHSPPRRKLRKGMSMRKPPPADEVLAASHGAMAAALSACAVGPNYVRPSAPLTPAFKEGPGPQTGWSPAQPMDDHPERRLVVGVQRSRCWTAWRSASSINNQNVAAAEAGYRAAKAFTAADRATFFPTLLP